MKKPFILVGSERCLCFYFFGYTREMETVDGVDRWKESEEICADLQHCREQMRRAKLREAGRRRAKGSAEGRAGDERQLEPAG